MAIDFFLKGCQGNSIEEGFIFFSTNGAETTNIHMQKDGLGPVPDAICKDYAKYKNKCKI